MGAFGEFFNQHGEYFVMGSLVLNIVLLAWMFVLHRKWRTIFRDRSGNLEDTLRAMRRDDDTMRATLQEHSARLTSIESLLPKNIRHTGLVRYNPFADAGGDQSFALALLDDEKSGIVISSLYGREMSRIYAKSIEKGNSKYQLSNEERQAIEKAMAF